MKANPERLYQDVEFLTSIYPYRNYKHIASLQKAAGYIRSEFQKSALEPISQTWEVEGNIYENIIAQYQPEKQKRLIIGAHYDVYKEQEGADDNASSVAGLLEMTRMIQEYAPSIDYGIDFIAYSLEEPPFFGKPEMGSYIHAQSLIGSTHRYIGMIALEMIGYFEGKPGVPSLKELFVAGIEKYVDFNHKVSSLLKQPQLMASRVRTMPNEDKNNGPSDHRNYWPLNIPGVMIIGSGGNGNPNYHKATDTIGTLDFVTMQKAVESIAYMIFNFQ